MAHYIPPAVTSDDSAGKQRVQALINFTCDGVLFRRDEIYALNDFTLEIASKYPAVFKILPPSDTTPPS